MLLGSMLMSGFGEWVLAFVAFVIMLEIKIYSEEQLLKTTFGEAFVEYKRRVPQLIPGLKWQSARSESN